MYMFFLFYCNIYILELDSQWETANLLHIIIRIGMHYQLVMQIILKMFWLVPRPETHLW